MDVEPLIREELGRVVPATSGGGPDWGDVLRRARSTRRWRRRLPAALIAAAAMAAAAAATPLGGAVVRTADDFSAWLFGEPGVPASGEEQRAFERANERSWASFPDGPKLRRLLVAEAAGGT